MQSNIRFYVLVAIVLVALGGFWFMIRGGKSTPSTVPPAKQMAKATEDKPEPKAETEHIENTKPVPESAAPTGNYQSVSNGARSGDGVVTGTAKDDSGDPVAGATVRLLPITWKNYEPRPADTATLETQTDNDGRFSFSGVPIKMSIGIEAELGTLYALDGIYIGERTKKTEVNLTLSQMAFIAGTVVDPEGAPVPGAVLFAAGWKEQAGDQDLPYAETEITRQRTDESGAFRFPHVPMGNFKFLVKSEDYAPMLSDWVLSGTENAKFVLKKGGAVAGKVIYSATREPASNVAILARTGISREEQRRETSADGAFAFSNLRDTDIQLAIDSENLTLAKEPEKIKLAPQQNIDGIVVEIDKGGIVSGFVRDAATNKGVRNARLQLYTENRGGGIINTSKDATTDEEGEYTIAGLPTGNYTIYVSEAEGYISEDYNKRQVISVTTGQSVDDINFTLDAGTSIAGRVVDDADQPIAQARVSVAMKRGGRWANAETDLNGLFTVMGVAISPDLFVRAEKDGLVSKPVGPLDTSTAPVEDVTITMTKEASIAGIVVDENGQPVPSAQVIPYPVKKDQQGFGSPIERANEKGEFKLARLAEGEYQLQAVLGNSAGWMQNPNKEVIRVAAGESKTGVRVLADGAGGLSISGRVTGEDGKPVRDANILALGPSTHANGRTDSDGRYKVADLKEGNFSLQVQASGYSRGILQIAAGSENADIVLKGTGKIEGMVVDTSGQPVTDFEILYAANAGMNMQNFQQMGPGARTRNDEGKFVVDDAQEGSATLLVKAQGYAPKMHVISDIVAGETKSGVVIEVETGGIVTGRVLDGSKNPVAGAKVFDTPAPMDEYRRDRAVRTTSGPDGAFQLDGLPSGTVTISAYHAAHAGANVQVTVAPGKTTQADIVLGGGGTVRIRITENGQPATGAYAGIQDKTRNDSTAKEPDENGMVEYTNIPAGYYRAYGVLRNPEGQGIPGRNQGKEITITEGGVTEVSLDFAAGTASIAGTIAFNGEPPTRAWVQMTIGATDTAGEDSRRVEVDANGQFRIENLPAGQVRLRANGMIGESAPVSRQQTVELADGRTTEVTFELGGGGTISGTVSGSPSEGYIGVALARGNITLPARTTQEEFMKLHRDEAIVSGAAVDPATGAFTIPGVEPGQYTVCATTADSSGAVRCATASVNVTEGETVTVSLTLPN